MADIIIAFPKIEDAKNLRRILNKNGHDVTLVCDSGAQIVSAANRLMAELLFVVIASRICTIQRFTNISLRGFRCYCWHHR